MTITRDAGCSIFITLLVQYYQPCMMAAKRQEGRQVCTKMFTSNLVRLSSLHKVGESHIPGTTPEVCQKLEKMSGGMKGILKGVFICRVAWWWKKTLRSSQDSNLGPLNSGQMLLPMSYWSSGIGAEDRWHLSIDTDRFSGWISLRLGDKCHLSSAPIPELQ